jgi:hypothetical protein
MADVKRRLDLIQPDLKEVRVVVEPMKDIVSNYKVWKEGVSQTLDKVEEFITRQDERAIVEAEERKSIAEILKTQKEDDNNRRKAMQWRIGLAVVVVLGILVVPIERAWDLVHDVVKLTEEWKQVPTPAKRSFFEQENQRMQDATAGPTHY